MSDVDVQVTILQEIFVFLLLSFHGVEALCKQAGRQVSVVDPHALTPARGPTVHNVPSPRCKTCRHDPVVAGDGFGECGGSTSPGWVRGEYHVAQHGGGAVTELHTPHYPDDI